MPDTTHATDPAGTGCASSEALADVHERLDSGEARFRQIEQELAANTRATQELAASTAELVEFFSAVRGAFRVLNWIGKAAKPISYIVALGAAVLTFWSAMKGAPK